MSKKRGNGEGTISKRKDGTWCAAITVGNDPETGKQKRRFFYGKTRAEVAEKLLKVQNDFRTGIYVEPNKITFGMWLDTWLEEYKRPQIRPSSYELYKSIINLHIKPTLDNVALQDIRPEHLQTLYNAKYDNGLKDIERGLSASSVKRMHTMIKNCLQQAIKNNLIPRNSAEATILPKIKKSQIQVFTLENQQKFLKALAGERMKAAFIIALATGIREGELLGLYWNDIDLEQGILSIQRSIRRVQTSGAADKKTALIFQEPKTESGKRFIPLPDAALTGLKEHKKQQVIEKLAAGEIYENECNLVFCTELGKPIDPRNFRKLFKRILNKANIPDIQFHALRHTFATRLLELNENPKVVQEILGHADISTTMNVYSHVLPDVKKAAAQKLNFLFESQ
jgi:integrase